MENSDPSPPLLRLDERDNIAVLCRSLGPDTAFTIGGRTYRTGRPLGLGHKIALCPIAPGEKVIKYGVAIGSATVAVAAGEHVHVHNLKSDYLPTYTLEEGRKYGAH